MFSSDVKPQLTSPLSLLMSLPAPVQRLPGVGPRGEPGGGAAGPAGEAELRAGPDEGAHVLPLLPGLRGGAGAGDRPQGPHQVGGDEQQVPEGHQRGYSSRIHLQKKKRGGITVAKRERERDIKHGPK